MRKVDLERPELEGVRIAGDPAKAFVEHVAKPPRPHFRFEYEQKDEMLAFLREHYEAWRNFNNATADKFAKMPLEKATIPNSRATVNIPCLGQAWWATGNPRYGAAFERFFLETETGEMFNWGAFNGSQAAYDLTGFLLLLDCPGLSTEGRIAFLDHLHAICDNAWDVHTSRWDQLMLGPEGHNWYLHGAHGLVHVGLLFPEFKRASFFVRTGLSVYEEHVRGHLKEDGGARETCLGYQSGSMSQLWDFYLIAHRNGYPVSSGFADRILKGTHFLLKLMSPAGGIPSFGDSGHTPGGLTTLVAIAAAMTGDRECKWYAEYCRGLRRNVPAETPNEIPQSAFWAVGLEGAMTYSRTRMRNPNHKSVLMGHTGYLAMRDAVRPEACYMAVAAADRGPIVTSHGHNDIFSLEVHAAGVRFIGEMGCAPYGNSPGRLYDQKTEAHTCLAIEGMEQAPIINEWRWSARLSPVVRRWISEETHDFFHGVHEGFYKFDEHKILHAHKIFFLKSRSSRSADISAGYWVVMDWVESNVENDYRIYFHGCMPAVTSGKNILLGNENAMRLAIMPPAEDDIVLDRVDSEGYAAYIREQKLTAEGYPSFVYGKRSMSDCFVWVIAPAKPGESLPVVKRLPVFVNGLEEDAHGATAVDIRFPEHRDMLCISHKDFDAELKVDRFSAWGNIAFQRTDSSGSVTLTIVHTMMDGVCGR